MIDWSWNFQIYVIAVLNNIRYNVIWHGQKRIGEVNRVIRDDEPVHKDHNNNTNTDVQNVPVSVNII